MLHKRIIYYILTAFVAGNILIIYIQYNSTKNVNSLINGNEKVLNELQVRSDLHELSKDITSVESKISGTLYTRYSSHIEDFGAKIKEVQHDIDNLQKISDDDTSVKYIDVLDPLVHKKLLLGQQVLDTLYKSGKVAAEKLISSNRAKELNDSIRLVTHIIESSRQKLLKTVTTSNNNSGKKALNLSTTLIVLVLVSGAILFWFIITVLQKQNQLILQLNATDKKVREAARVKENFLANMSHEIRTPVNAILGFTHLLHRKHFDSESKEYVQTIQKAGENLLTIINDILDLSKIEAGMMRIESAPFNIRKLLHSVELMFKPKMAEKKLQLFIDIDESLPEILEGDGNRLTQILVNLVGNALKFTAKGNITIKIANNGIVDDIVKTNITVADTGIGIEKEKLQYIFERFQQAEDSVTRKYGGTGLGLSIVNDLILLQNGNLYVESEPGIGTTFKVMIPYKISAEPLSPSVNNINTIKELPRFDNIRILITEDNEINQTLLKHLFRSWNLNFDIANNGIAALKKIETNKYDLILMDIQMPEMDGYTATMEIRNKLKLDIPIVAMTAHAFSGEREKCLSYGMNEYISKPIRETTLFALIKQFTKSKLSDDDQKLPRLTFAEMPYKYISLQYMKEISRGNIEYEKTVTDQFIEAIPDELILIEQSWQNNNTNQLRQSAHNMKTSVSIMGLNEMLENDLDFLEYENLTEESFQDKFSSLKYICTAALEEAKQFYAMLNVLSPF
jgi:signal transduction histidine kinase/CheY-like chemotaxis protein/HPt (histidine-containing phosphotransfer) domain-containing protein